jgi:NAD+ diphosphatase
MDPAWVAARLADPDTRVLAGAHDTVLLSAHTAALARLDTSVDANDAILLGLESGRALFALDLEGIEPKRRAALEDDHRALSLREAGSVLPEEEGGLAAYLVALLNWHRRHRYCANCGAATEIVEGGYSRRCPRCRATHFPRTDPVVIMVVEHDDRLLLGRRRGWPEGRYSVLAGFVAPGETAEAAVIREVREESGLVCTDPRFVTSQPWPFPMSLMLGFEASSPGGEPHSVDGELEDVRWFGGEEVRAAAKAAAADSGSWTAEARPGELLLPPPVSIAHALIARWAARSAGDGAAALRPATPR